MSHQNLEEGLRIRSYLNINAQLLNFHDTSFLECSQQFSLSGFILLVCFLLLSEGRSPVSSVTGTTRYSE